MVLFLLQNKRLSDTHKALIVAMGSVLVYMKYHYLEHSVEQLIAGGVLGATIHYLLQAKPF